MTPPPLRRRRLRPLGTWTIAIVKRAYAAKDFGALATAATWVMIASVKLIMRRLATT